VIYQAPRGTRQAHGKAEAARHSPAAEAQEGLLQFNETQKHGFSGASEQIATLSGRFAGNLGA
jgi:hypothetical protein